MICLALIFIKCAKEDNFIIIAPDIDIDVPGPTRDSSFRGIKYLALGDSYTIGQSVPVQERFPVQLGKKLEINGFDIDTIDIIAMTGWTTDELIQGINNRNDFDSVYQLVSLLIGVNNQYRGYPITTYDQEFTELLNKAIAFAGGKRERVFVVSIPDYAYTPFGNGNSAISNGIDQYNAVNNTISNNFGVAYFDITPISRDGLADLSLVAPDGLHPSGYQYSLWIELMLEDLLKMLN